MRTSDFGILNENQPEVSHALALASYHPKLLLGILVYG